MAMNVREQGAAAMVASSVLGKLERQIELLERIAYSLEDEPDLDQTWVVGGNPAAAAVVPIQLPRTIKHVEITLSVTGAVEVAVLSGNYTTAQSGQIHGHNAGVVGPSAAICTSGGGAVTARDYLDESGYLTVYFAAAGTAYANVRLRSLGRTQSHAKRT